MYTDLPIRYFNTFTAVHMYNMCYYLISLYLLLECICHCYNTQLCVCVCHSTDSTVYYIHVAHECALQHRLGITDFNHWYSTIHVLLLLLPPPLQQERLVGIGIDWGRYWEQRSVLSLKPVENLACKLNCCITEKMLENPPLELNYI